MGFFWKWCSHYKPLRLNSENRVKNSLKVKFSIEKLITTFATNLTTLLTRSEFFFFLQIMNIVWVYGLKLNKFVESFKIPNIRLNKFIEISSKPSSRLNWQWNSLQDLFYLRLSRESIARIHVSCIEFNVINKFHCWHFCCSVAICDLPKDEGYYCPGGSPEPKYLKYFNSETQFCEELIYQGCGGNLNRFDSQAQCETFCIVQGNARPESGSE